VANGDLSKKITVDVRGEILELKNTINVMVDQLNAFAGEVTRVAREVGTEGKLGGQAQVQGVGGVWKDLTDNVNFMAGNLTDQVRGIARVVTAVAQGDLKRRLTVEAKGEIAALAETINEMTETLATFAAQVTSVAREVGVEGRLGGQASVPGAAGTWKDLVENVNIMAGTLTTQVRAIADVATAVTEGDLTRSIGVEARGEVAVLKDKINQMIGNLKETTQRNTEQDWLKTNLARFTRMLQGQRDRLAVARMILSELAPLVSAQHGVFYMVETGPDGEPVLRLHAAYAYRERKNLAGEFRLGEGLVGQCALERERILVTNVPADYVRITSGLGEAVPLNIIVLPVVFENEVKAVIELASFERFSPTHQDFLDQLMESIGIVVNTIEANMRTEELLKQSQSLAHELQSQQQELQQTNDELQAKARLLAEQNVEVERKNLEVEQARRSLEEKAEQLALTSRYKSEFLANMSHELRTPLNSLLILAQQLAENAEQNLTEKQVEFANIIRASGNDLLNLINDILDHSKIESGTVALDVEPVEVAELRDFAERSFRHLAEGKGLGFAVTLDPGLPTHIWTDAKRLQQVLRNLVSNAVKFTERGAVEVVIEPATGGWNTENRSLREAQSVIAFRVRDTGIGIPAEKQKIIFEAFQQADGTTSRKYGGTGLGLSISRGLVALLGGEIRLESVPDQGSTFTVYLPAGLPREAAEPALDLAPASAAEPVDPLPALLEPAPEGEAEAPARVADDRASVRPGDRVVLLVEDDATFATVLLDLAHQNGFKGLVALSADEAVALAQEVVPDAVTLDIGLGERSGWTVLERLRRSEATRQIPVHVISVREEDAQRGLEEGLTFLTKPVTKETLEALFRGLRPPAQGPRRILVVEDDPVQQRDIVAQLTGPELDVLAVGTGQDAIRAVEQREVDCIVLDLGLPDMSGFDLIDRVREDPRRRGIPIIVYTALDLTKRAQSRLRKSTRSVLTKDRTEPDRLLEKVRHFLMEAVPDAPEPPAKLPRARPAAKARAARGNGHRRAAPPPDGLGGRRVLVVDDDVRNVFALTALLERHGMEVLTAENGMEAIEILERTPGIDVVLMDVMMPEMDGYQTIGEIRKRAELRGLPIIALTAKAMKGDRERCLAAGASDYVAKPVDPGQLVSLLRIWVQVARSHAG
jgi:CheY-like chemotaxis protein/HAMP domain-containing protein